MKKSRFTEEQIISILKEQDQGLKVAEICRKHGLSDQTFHNWKKKYGGLTVDELRTVQQNCSRRFTRCEFIIRHRTCERTCAGIYAGL